MKLRGLLCGVVLIGLSVLAARPVPAAKSKGKGKGKAPSPADMQAAMKAMEKFAAPGAAHKMLESRVGSWEFTMKMWMDPKAPPTESKGTTEVKSIFDGRFIVEEVSGDFMGMQFKGMGTTGYDNFRKHYVGTWFDNMGTSILTMSGNLSKDGKTMTMAGKMDDPMTGEKDQTVKYVSKIQSNDKYSMAMWVHPKKGKPVKAMEIAYTRKS